METQSSSGTAVDNSSAAESSGKHVEWTGKPCQHLEKGIDLEKLEQHISRVSLLQCQGCGELRKGSNGSASKDKKGKSKMYVKKGAAKDEWLRTWMCLACAHVGCSSISNASEVIGTGHTWKHWLDTKHPYAVQWGEDVRCWCFSCKALLEFGFLEDEENKGLVMVGPSASESMLQALRVVQEKLVKESVKFREIRLPDAIVEDKPLPSEEGRSGNREEDGSGSGSGSGSRRLVKGLTNLGNTCFFNSVLQNLLAIGVLQDHFTRPAVVTEGRLTSCLRKLYAEMTSERQAATDSGEGCSSNGLLYGGKGRALWENRNGIVNPGSLFSAVCDQAPSFRGFHQQDSQEFLLYLLDCLNTEELNTVKSQNASYETFAEKGDGNTKESVDGNTKESVDSDGVQSDKFTSFFSSVFGSELSSTVCCSECGHSSVSFESFLDLSLAMPSKPKPSASNIWTSSSRYAKRLTKTHDGNSMDGQRAVETGSSSLLNISEVNKEPLDEMEEGSCSLYKSIAPGAGARDTSKSDFSEDFGWMDFLDAPAQSADMVFQENLNTSEITEVLAQEDTSVNVSEMTSMGQLSTSTSACQNQGHIDENAVFSQIETSEKNLSTTEGDFGTNDDQDMMHVSDWEDNQETGQEEELLQMVGDSEVLFLPYKDIDAAEEGSEALGYFQNLSLGSRDETLDKQSGDAPLSGINPDVIEGDFDGFAEMFNEDENSFFQKFEAEAGDNFQLNEENGGDDIWDIELAGTTEEGSETNKEGPEGSFHPISLDGCLTAFTRPELLSGENAWECENCSSKILNDSCKWCVGVSRLNNKQIQYKQTVISTLNDTGTYEEQVHLVNGGGSISVCKGAVDTNLSKLPEKQIGISMFECKGPSNIEGEINKHCHLKNSSKAVSCHTESVSLGFTEKGSNMGQHVASFSDLDTSQAYTKQCYFSETETPDRAVITLKTCNSCPDDFSGQENSGEKSGRSFDEDALIDNNAEAHLANEKVVTNAHLTCRQIGKNKQSFSVLGRDNFDSRDLIYDDNKLKNGNLNLPLRGIRLDGSFSKENEKQPKGLKRNATKVLLISKAPLVLTIHLKRFGQDILGRLSKLSGHVTFHNKLDLRPFLDPRCPDKEKCIYHLIGVVEHSGSMRGGHYVAYVRGPKDEKVQEANDEDDPNQSTWYCISDSSVRKISFSEVLQREAYLLFYEKDVL